MELYVTKKADSSDDFSFVSSPDAVLPLLHVVTPVVEIHKDAAGGYFIVETTEGELSNMIKLKRLVCKSVGNEEKTKMADDILWVKPSPVMYYKKDQVLVPCTRMLLNHSVRLQVSCKSDHIYRMPKPYNVTNMFWTIDVVLVDKDFPWEALSG